ncbi:hypothetical protein DPM33_32985 [Mesorhizobium hawassense]|uniref:Uncharacterized protein n=1 Tax=Mesorhizobium hawassense TaxID=1209954 RepID=A0A330H4B5_9HYPH|nr:hypothetical protein [Mesorhizobium hawassense]RAZ83200.1 hypothetical protein DPM33_32985 [Mesorhizobium hawassense]
MAKSSEFHVPSLAEADTEYAAIESRLAELVEQHALAHHEVAALEDDMRARPAPRIRSGVAELLGDVVDTTLHQRPAKLKDLRQRVADLEAATKIMRDRLKDRRSAASLAACAMVREEYGRRVAKACAALEAFVTANAEAEKVLDSLEREDVGITYLPSMRPLSAFTESLGRYILDAQRAGYVS